MGFWQRGKWVPLPWNHKFEGDLAVMADRTYDYEGDELLHAIHKELIQANWINLRLHNRIIIRLDFVIAVLVLLAALFWWK